MELWIRSQDKKRLVKVDYVYIEPTYGLEICCGSYHCLNQNIGTYTTNERALEVLDEIHGCIQTNAGFEMYSNLGRFSDDFNKKYNLVPVYLMPKE